MSAPTPEAPSTVTVTGDTVVAPCAVTLADEDVVDILEIAGYGIGYWAAELVIHSEFDPPKFGVIEHEGQQWHERPFSDVRLAFGRLLAHDQKLVGDRLHAYVQHSVRDADVDGRPDLGHIDADAADVIVQVALFGEVVYG